MNPAHNHKFSIHPHIRFQNASSYKLNSTETVRAEAETPKRTEPTEPEAREGTEIKKAESPKETKKDVETRERMYTSQEGAGKENIVLIEGSSGSSVNNKGLLNRGGTLAGSLSSRGTHQQSLSLSGASGSIYQQDDVETSASSPILVPIPVLVNRIVDVIQNAPSSNKRRVRVQTEGGDFLTGDIYTTRLDFKAVWSEDSWYFMPEFAMSVLKENQLKARETLKNYPWPEDPANTRIYGNIHVHQRVPPELVDNYENLVIAKRLTGTVKHANLIVSIGDASIARNSLRNSNIMDEKLDSRNVITGIVDVDLVGHVKNLAFFNSYALGQDRKSFKWMNAFLERRDEHRRQTDKPFTVRMDEMEIFYKIAKKHTQVNALPDLVSEKIFHSDPNKGPIEGVGGIMRFFQDQYDKLRDSKIPEIAVYLSAMQSRTQFDKITFPAPALTIHSKKTIGWLRGIWKPEVLFFLADTDDKGENNRVKDLYYYIRARREVQNGAGRVGDTAMAIPFLNTYIDLQDLKKILSPDFRQALEQWNSSPHS